MNAICVLIYWHLGCPKVYDIKWAAGEWNLKTFLTSRVAITQKKMLAIFCSFYSWQIIVYRNLLVLGIHNLKHFSTVLESPRVIIE